jgi:hypothetical protein
MPGDTREDISGYTAGNRFSYSYGFGVRWRLNQNMQMRADLGWLLYKMNYPSNYFSTAADPQSIIPAGSSTSFYVTNRLINVGYSWGLFR